MNNPLVSIIVPAYNTADVIVRTLESIEKQTYSNFQIVIINDGSTDDTKQILNEYGRNKDNVIIWHQKNQGVSAARNKGIELAEGTFVCFLDSDDTYNSLFLEEMIRRQQESGSKAVYCGYNTIDENGKKAEIKLIYPYEGNIIEYYYFIKGFHFHISGVIFEKEMLIKNNIIFDIDMKYGEDLFFVIKVICATEFYAVEKYLINYFYRNNSATRLRQGDNEENAKIELNFNQKIFNYISDNYVGNNKNKVLKQWELGVFSAHLNLLQSYLEKFEYKKIVNYDYLDKIIQFCHKNYSFLAKRYRRKFNFIRYKNYFAFFLGTLYYRYIRVNFKRL